MGSSNVPTVDDVRIFSVNFVLYMCLESFSGEILGAPIKLHQFLLYVY